MCWVFRRGKNRSTQRKTSRSKDENKNKLNPHMTPSPGIDRGPHWWKVSALTTAPSLLLSPPPGNRELDVDVCTPYLVQMLAQFIGKSTHRAHNIQSFLHRAVILLYGFFAKLGKQLFTFVSVVFNSLYTTNNNKTKPLFPKGDCKKIIFLTRVGTQICHGFKAHELITCESKVQVVVALGS